MIFWILTEQPLRAPSGGWVDLPESVPADVDSIQPIYLIGGLVEAKRAGDKQVWATLIHVRIVPGETPLTEQAVDDLTKGSMFCSGFVAISDLVSTWIGDHPVWLPSWRVDSLGEHASIQHAEAEARTTLMENR